MGIEIPYLRSEGDVHQRERGSHADPRHCPRRAVDGKGSVFIRHFRGPGSPARHLIEEVSAPPPVQLLPCPFSKVRISALSVVAASFLTTCRWYMHRAGSDPSAGNAWFSKCDSRLGTSC
jgi:hypothetical protein